MYLTSHHSHVADINVLGPELLFLPINCLLCLLCRLLMKFSCSKMDSSTTLEAAQDLSLGMISFRVSEQVRRE